MNTNPDSRYGLRWLVPLLATLCCPPVVASPDEVDDETIDTVTVIATRTERALDEVAATVSVKTAEDIDRELTRDIADLVRFEPGVSVAGTGSRFGLTGFRIRGIGGNRVLTLIDGVRVPDEFSFGPFLSARRDLVDIDSLERGRDRPRTDLVALRQRCARGRRRLHHQGSPRPREFGTAIRRDLQGWPLRSGRQRRRHGDAGGVKPVGWQA